MSAKGFSHIGLSTLDLDKTRNFYENVLGFKPVICDIIKVKEGGRIRHVFFDTGRDQLIAFMEARDIPGVPVEYDAGINRGLGVPNAFYHFAFEAGTEAGLERCGDARPLRNVRQGARVGADRLIAVSPNPECVVTERFLIASEGAAGRTCRARFLQKPIVESSLP